MFAASRRPTATFVVSLGKLSTAAGSAAIVLLTSAVLPAAARGQLAAAIAGVTLIATVCSISLWFGISLVLPKEPRLVGTAVRLSLAWPLGLFAVVTCAVIGGVRFGSGAMTVSVLVVAGSLTSYSILQGIPIGLGRMALFGAAEIVRGIVGLIAVGSLLAAGWRSVPGLLVAWGLGCLAAQALVTFYAARQPSNRPASVFAFVKRVTRPSLALHPSSILGLAVVRLDLVVLALLAGRVAVAYYSLAVAASEAASLIPSAIGLANYSDVARQSSDSARGATIARAKRATVVALAVAIFVATVARFSLGRVLPAQYSHALPALYIALAGTCVYSVSWVLMPYIAVTRTRMITASVATATLAVNMILLVPLADRFGATGAAIASSIAYTTGTLMNCVVFVVARRSHPDKAEVANQGDQSLPMPGLASR